jgi:hypothetical protein
MPGSASPPFFLTIVVVQNVPLLMTESSITVHATNHQSFRQLSQKHVVLDVIHVVTSGHVTSCYFIPVRTASGHVTSSNTCVMARSPLLPLNYALSYPDILL